MDKKIFMIVETDAALLAELSSTLRSIYEGAVVYSATEAKEAINKIRNVPPQVVITELELPKVSGSEIVRAVLKDKELTHTSVVVLSDIPDKEEFVEGVVQGRVLFLSKPVDKKLFLDVVNKALQRASSQKDPEFKLKFLSAGEILFKEGDKAESAFLVKKGKLKAVKSKSGTEVLLGDVNAGEFVGEMAHINGEPRSADIRAVENCELIEIPLGTLDILLFSKPAWSKALMKTLSKRLKASQK